MDILLMDNIPLDCLSIIFSFLGVEDIPNLLFLCKRFSLVFQRDSLWKTIFHRNVDKGYILHPEFMIDENWKKATLKNYPKEFKLNVKSKTDMFNIHNFNTKGITKNYFNYVLLSVSLSGKLRYIPVTRHFDEKNQHQRFLCYLEHKDEQRLTGGWTEDTISLVTYPFHHRLEMMTKPKGYYPYFNTEYLHSSECLLLEKGTNLLLKTDLSPVFKYLE